MINQLRSDEKDGLTAFVLVRYEEMMEQNMLGSAFPAQCRSSVWDVWKAASVM
jgi:hypothetical protein